MAKITTLLPYLEWGHMSNNVLIKHFEGRVDQIETEISIRSRFDEDENHYQSYDAIWDTGAMSSCLAPKIADEMKLQPIGFMFIRGVGGENIMKRPVYLVDLKLSNGMIIKGVRIIGVEVGGGDVLVGMDVISRGDFAIFHDEQGDMNMSFKLL